MSVRRRLFIVFAIAAVLLAVAIPRLRIEADVLNLMPQHMPELQSLKTLRERFQDEGKLIVALRLPEAEAAIAAETEEMGDDLDPESPDLEMTPDAADILGEAAESLGAIFRTTEGLAHSVEGDSMRDALRNGAS